MSLIKCPECGHQVSDKASFCPHCGLPQNEILLNRNNRIKTVFRIARHVSISTFSSFRSVYADLIIDDVPIARLTDKEDGEWVDQIVALLPGDHNTIVSGKDDYGNMYNNSFILSIPNDVNKLIVGLDADSKCRLFIKYVKPMQ